MIIKKFGDNEISEITFDMENLLLKIKNKIKD
jgi:hypothetical protein